MDGKNLHKEHVFYLISTKQLSSKYISNTSNLQNKTLVNKIIRMIRLRLSKYYLRKSKYYCYYQHELTTEEGVRRPHSFG